MKRQVSGYSEACTPPDNMHGFSSCRDAALTCLSMLPMYLVYECLLVSFDSCSRVARIVPLPYSKGIQKEDFAHASRCCLWTVCTAPV